MIEIKPHAYSKFQCPKCHGDDPDVKMVEVWGLVMLANCTCHHCGFAFINTLPVGHMVDQSIALDADTHRFYNTTNTAHWFLDILKESMVQVRKDDVKIEKRIFRVCREVVILNTIDFLYGHTLLKLFNAQSHIEHDQPLGLIIIIPKIIQWLIPDGCAEAWIVDLPLHEARWRFQGIKDFVETEMERFDRVFLSKAYSHPDLTALDIKRFTGVAAFQMELFSATVPTFTFVVREDRWWLASGIHYWFYRALRKFRRLDYGSGLLAKFQNRLIKKVIRNIREVLPEARFIVAGLGKSGSFQGYAEDCRAEQLDSTQEVFWCQLYAKSHVVVGVHGSNMLLPTALAAGCVEILPEDRYGNVIQDIAVRFSDRRSLFLYRFVPQFTNAPAVSRHLLSMVQGYDKFHRDMCVNNYANFPFASVINE